MVGIGAFLSLTDAGGKAHRDVYAEALSLAREAERLGCDAVWINEHHFMGFSICPDSLVMASALLAQSSKIRVGNAVSLIPLQNPLSIAERVAMLDNISGGRFDLGLGRGGYPLDAMVFGRPLDQFNTAMDEGIAFIHQALSSPYVTAPHVPPVQIYPRPFTQPHPPILVAGQGESTMRIAAERGLSLLLSWHQNHTEREAVVRRYAVLATAPTHHVGSACVYIADSRAQAEAEFAPKFRDWLRTGRSGVFDRAVDDPRLAELLKFADAKAATEDAVVAKLMANNPIGRVEDVVAWFREDIARTGTQRYAVFCDIIGDPVRARANLTRLMTQVVPAL
ncbi:MAG: LLM class flavin-dependent oxidoreductase [Rhodospirillaceae bacterium]|nr:LLM class flavin-dependent oxidoreductase [Rhodospirillaceae bacterium]